MREGCFAMRGSLYHIVRMRRMGARWYFIGTKGQAFIGGFIVDIVIAVIRVEIQLDVIAAFP